LNRISGDLKSGVLKGRKRWAEEGLEGILPGGIEMTSLSLEYHWAGS
jgi:hypothetical protein